MSAIIDERDFCGFRHDPSLFRFFVTELTAYHEWKYDVLSRKGHFVTNLRGKAISEDKVEFVESSVSTNEFRFILEDAANAEDTWKREKADESVIFEGKTPHNASLMALTELRSRAFETHPPTASIYPGELETMFDSGIRCMVPSELIARIEEDLARGRVHALAVEVELKFARSKGIHRKVWGIFCLYEDYPCSLLGWVTRVYWLPK